MSIFPLFFILLAISDSSLGKNHVEYSMNFNSLRSIFTTFEDFVLKHFYISGNYEDRDEGFLDSFKKNCKYYKFFLVYYTSSY